MQVKILEEAGYDHALRGMALSYHDRATDVDEWWSVQREKGQKRAPLLAPMDGGHNKFLRQLEMWVEVEAPRCFFSEFDTYKVGTTAQSESTMHTLGKRPPTKADFEEGTPDVMIAAFTAFWHDWKAQDKPDIAELKCALPEGFLQRRVVTMNYAVLRNIVQQRQAHKLRYWRDFCNQIVPQLQHPELFTLESKM